MNDVILNVQTEEMSHILQDGITEQKMQQLLVPCVVGQMAYSCFLQYEYELDYKINNFPWITSEKQERVQAICDKMIVRAQSLKLISLTSKPWNIAKLHNVQTLQELEQFLDMHSTLTQELFEQILINCLDKEKGDVVVRAVAHLSKSKKLKEHYVN